MVYPQCEKQVIIQHHGFHDDPKLPKIRHSAIAMKEFESIVFIAEEATPF